MNEPNRLSAPGEHAALERVEEIAERIDEVPIERMTLPRTRMLSPEHRGALLEELDTGADRCGRRVLLEDARNRVRQAVLARTAQPLYLYSGSPQRADDISYIATSIVDAVAVAVMEDRLSLETASLLSTPGRNLLGLAPVAAAARMPVGLRIWVATIAAVVFAPVAVLLGVGIGQTGAGILAGLAIVAVCWLVATYRR